MKVNEYQMAAMRTAAKYDSKDDQLLNGLMGLNGEAGEAIDLMKKHMFQGHDLDVMHMAKELGDVAWYLALCADAILTMNITKLKARYPDGFDAGASQHRAEGDL